MDLPETNPPAEAGMVTDHTRGLIHDASMGHAVVA